MFAELPKLIQEQILYYLEANNFQAAKELRDQCLFFRLSAKIGCWDSKELQSDALETT